MPKPLFSHVLNLRNPVSTTTTGPPSGPAGGSLQGTYPSPTLAPGASVVAAPGITRGAGPFTLTTTAQVIVELTPTYQPNRPVVIFGICLLKVVKITAAANGGNAFVRLHTGGTTVTDGTLVTMLDTGFLLATNGTNIGSVLPILGTLSGAALPAGGPLRIKLWALTDNTTDYTMTIPSVELFSPWQFA